MHIEQILIGITGNIGSGKSLFCQLLRESGFTVVSSDEIAQKHLDDPESLKQLTKRWGKNILKNGKPDRQKIADIVFNNKAELVFLNSLIHPKTLVALQNFVDEHQEKYLFFETPLLFEASLQNCFDYIVLIRTDPVVRLKRLAKMGKSSIEQLRIRMDSQIDDLNKLPLCDLVIENDGTIPALKKKLLEFVSRLDSLKQKEKIPFSS